MTTKNATPATGFSSRPLPRFSIPSPSRNRPYLTTPATAFSTPCRRLLSSRTPQRRNSTPPPINQLLLLLPRPLLFYLHHPVSSHKHTVPILASTISVATLTQPVGVSFLIPNTLTLANTPSCPSPTPLTFSHLPGPCSPGGAAWHSRRRA